MTDMIARELNKLDLIITDPIIDGFNHMVLSWEVRGIHPIALNGQKIGVSKIAFTDGDRAAFFDIFNLDPKQMKLVLQKITTINADYKVISDPFNLLSIWLLHLALRDIHDEHRRTMFMMDVAKYLHYRWFTSSVNHNFPHGAVDRYMTAAINGLSRKFDLIIYGTWKKMIEARCEDLISPQGIHHNQLLHADDDVLFLYALTDTNTRIRDKIRNITAEYYKARESGSEINSRGATTEIEGEKALVSSSRTLDLMVFNLTREVETERLFIDHQTVRSIVTQFKNVTENLLNSALRSMVEIAQEQKSQSQLDLVKINDKRETYVGIRKLITMIIQKSYLYCLRNKTDITNKAQTFIRVKNIYSSSRVIDEDILSVKQSVAYLVDRISTSGRETTKSSLRLAIIMYIITRSFRYI